MIDLFASYAAVPQIHKLTTNRLCSTKITDSTQLVQREREYLTRSGAIERSAQVVHGRPFDIYVEYGQGARVLARFGTEMAREISKKSPLCRAYQQQRDALARRRAGLSS